MKNFTSPHGQTFACCNEAEAMFMWEKLYNEREYGMLKYREGDVIVDVGGNMGMFAKWAGEQCGQKSTIISFEPMPVLRACLQQNVRDCDIVLPFAVSDCEEELELEFLPNYTLLSGLSASSYAGMYEKAAMNEKKHLVKDAFKAVKVQANSVTLAKALNDPAIPQGPISVLKIDVEGMEWRVLSGIDYELWDRVQQTVIEVHDVGTRVEDVCNLLEKRGFRVERSKLAPPSFLLGDDVAPEKNLSTCVITGIREQ